MAKMDNLTLLHLFHQCSHRLHVNGKFCGQGRLLILLLEKGTLTQRELIDITGRRSATLSEQLENMDKAGLVTRSRNEQDQRNVDVSLTPLGRETAKEAQNNRLKQAHALFSVLNEEEKEQLYRLLHKLLTSWNNFPQESEVVQR